jgi:hypothetical protein
VDVDDSADERPTPVFDIAEQRAGVVNNVARDQYFQQIVVAREDAFRQLDSMSRAVRVLYFLGFGLAGCGALAFIGSVAAPVVRSSTVDIRDHEAFDQTMQPPTVAGVPLSAIGMGAALVGFALCLVAVLINGTVTRQRRDIDARFPLPPNVTQ